LREKVPNGMKEEEGGNKGGVLSQGVKVVQPVSWNSEWCDGFSLTGIDIGSLVGPCMK